MARAPRPFQRGQGNDRFVTSDPKAGARRGQTVPYDNNGAPTGGTAADTAALNGQPGSHYLDRANHTGTQAASTISDLAEAVQDTLGTAIVAGDHVSATYDDTAGTLTLQAAQGPAHVQITGVFLDASITGTAVTTLAGVADRFDLVPFIPSRDIAVAEIGVSVTTAVAATNAKVQVYSSNANGLPDALIVESTDLDCATTGFKGYAWAQTLKRGVRYWVGVRTSGAQTLAALATGSLRPLGITGASGSGSVAISIRKTLAYATAAPNPFGAVASGDLSPANAYRWLAKAA